MTKKDYILVTDVLRGKASQELINAFCYAFENSNKNFKRDFFIEYIEKGKITKETKNIKKTVSIDTKEKSEENIGDLFKDLKSIMKQI
jgi:hypothetical protein